MNEAQRNRTLSLYEMLTRPKSPQETEGRREWMKQIARKIGDEITHDLVGRERLAFRLKYGFEDEREWTYREIGQHPEIHSSESTAWRIVRSARAKLHSARFSTPGA